MFLKITIFEDYLLIFKTGNSKVVESIFSEKVSHNFMKNKSFKKKM